MGYTKYRPRYPVISNNPSLSLVFKNVRSNELLLWSAVTLGSLPLGYFSSPIRRLPIALTAAVIGFSAGFTYCFQQSGLRFLGHKENADLVKKYPYRLDYTDYQVRTEPFREIIDEEDNDIHLTPRY